MAINQIQMPRESPISRLADLVQGGLQIAQGVQNLKLNSEKLDALKRGEAKLVAENTALENPESTESQLYRSIAKQSGQNVPETASAKQLQNVYGSTLAQYPLLAAREKGQEQRALRLLSARSEMNKKEEKPTQSQFTAATFSKRALQAENDLAKVSEKLDPGSLSVALQSSKLFPEILKSEEVKRLTQAKRNFVNAVLRRESGAAISPSEFENANAQYFGQEGDNAEVLAQKAENRRIAIAGLQAEAGNVAPQRVSNALASLPSSQNRRSERSSGLINEAFAADQPQVRVVGNSVFVRQNGKWVEQ